MSDEQQLAATLAVAISRIDDLREDIAGLRTDLSDIRTSHVTRGEWEQRNNFSDSKFHSIGREVGDLRAELNSRRAPWWSVVAVGAALGALIWSIFGPAVIAL